MALSLQAPLPCAMPMQNAGGEMKKFIKTEGTVYLWCSLGMYLLLAGCGTLQGIGRDMQTVGAWMEEQGPP